MEKKWMIAAAVGIILVFLMRGFFKKEPSVQQQIQAPFTEKIIAVDKKGEVVVAHTQLVAQQKEFLKNVKMGVTTVRLNVDKGAVNLSIKIKPEVRYCSGGETDTMKRSATNLSKPEFLLTMESMDNRSKPVVAKKYRVSELEQGDTVSFSLPLPTKKDELYGVYICHDREGKNSCREKKLLDYGSLTQYKNPPGKKNDYLYIFHKVLIRPDGIVNLFSALGGKKQFQEIDDYLTKDGGPSGKAIQVADSNERRLRDRDLHIDGSVIEMPIVIGDHNCFSHDKKNPTPPPASGKGTASHVKAPQKN